MEYSPDALAEAAAAYRRIEGFVTRAAEAGPAGATDAEASVTGLPFGFGAALDDDLAVPQALAVVHEAVTEGNTALAAGDMAGAAKQAAAVRGMMSVLGLDPLGHHWSGPDGAGGGALRPVVDALVEVALQQRQAARDRKDFAEADAIRDRLKDAGILVEDTMRGSRWELGR
jgi:cysteinyl-tRNA synthetase